MRTELFDVGSAEKSRRIGRDSRLFVHSRHQGFSLADQLRRGSMDADPSGLPLFRQLFDSVRLAKLSKPTCTIRATHFEPCWQPDTAKLGGVRATLGSAARHAEDRRTRMHSLSRRTLEDSDSSWYFSCCLVRRWQGQPAVSYSLNTIHLSPTASWMVRTIGAKK